MENNMKNTFCKFIIEKWLLIRGVIVNNRSSNARSQYLECLIQDYAREHDMYVLREFICKSGKKLDYLIAEGDYNKDYFFKDTVSREQNVDWHAVIEAQWDKKKKDMLKDFENLTEWSASSDDKVRVAIFSIGGGEKRWKDKHERFMKDLGEKANNNKGYLILLTTVFSKKKKEGVGFSAYYNWKGIEQKILS